MELDKTKFCEYLACYGSDINTWPKEVQALGFRAQHHPEYAALLEEEIRFERLLLEDGILPAPADLVTRLLIASQSRSAITEPPPHFFQARAYINPAAFAAMLVIGFAIGFKAFTPTSQNVEESFLQSYSDDEEMTL